MSYYSFLLGVYLNSDWEDVDTDDIIGYTFNGDAFCPSCAIQILGADPEDPSRPKDAYNPEWHRQPTRDDQPAEGRANFDNAIGALQEAIDGRGLESGSISIGSCGSCHQSLARLRFDTADLTVEQ